MPKGSLTPKQQRFVEEYLIDFNATQAAIRAGYSKATADKIGAQLLGKTRSEIDARRQKLAARAALSANETVHHIGLIATSNIQDFMTWDPRRRTMTLKGPEELTREQCLCIQEIQQVEQGGTRSLRIRLHDKMAALNSLAKYHNLYKRTATSKGLIVNILRPPLPAASTPVPSGPPIQQRPQLQVTFKRPPGVGTSERS